MTQPANVLYAREQDLDVAEFRRVLAESGLGTKRPLDDEARLSAMLSGANLVVTARLDSPGRPLIGFARCSTDFAWACYVADLAVSSEAHGQGVGQGLIEEVRRQVGTGVTVLLVSVPEAVGFYQRIGMAPAQNAFWFRRET